MTQPSKTLLDRATTAGLELDQLLSVNPGSSTDSKMLTPASLRQGNVVAFQRVVKMGVIASGEFGSGFVLAKVPASNGVGFKWSAPAFYSIKGGSLGLTTAVESIHTIIVMTTLEAGLKLASGGTFMGPDFELTFANDYSSTKRTQEGMLSPL
ncbi:hypothetical protein WJX84_001012 [Apatococcus fuscideae]|uniref:Ysc84 actin-binding domain-containing protein n=1 Tax=Apatococcus fuscideae TaxID=2026836 RepID=A0AAW1SXF3_9CHLO